MEGFSKENLIWVFELNLPWVAGADFFLRHLLDGDPASNTLSWRWTAGLHTKGKKYIATAANIEKFTNGRFSVSENPLKKVSINLSLQVLKSKIIFLMHYKCAINFPVLSPSVTSIYN